MSKLTISIGSKDFDITLESEFSKYFEEEFRDDFGQKTTIDTKELLYAYVQKCYEKFISKEEYKKISDRIDGIV
jgi:hypothetical protein